MFGDGCIWVPSSGLAIWTSDISIKHVVPMRLHMHWFCTTSQPLCTKSQPLGLYSFTSRCGFLRHSSKALAKKERVESVFLCSVAFASLICVFMHGDARKYANISASGVHAVYCIVATIMPFCNVMQQHITFAYVFCT